VARVTLLAVVAACVATLAALVGLLAVGAPAHADGAFSVAVTGTESAGKDATARDGSTLRKVTYTLHTGGAPHLAIALDARVTLFAGGQPRSVAAPDGSQQTVIGTILGQGTISDPIGGTPLFDVRLRGGILPDQSQVLFLNNASASEQIALRATLAAGDGRTLAGTATGTLTLAAGTTAEVTSDVWGAAAVASGSSDPTLWYLTRGAAATAYLLLAVVVALGISLGVRAFDGVLRGWRVLDLHQVLTLVMFAFVGLHLVTLALDPYKPYTVAQLFWPFTQAYRPLPAALGVLALYLLVAVTLSSYLRRGIGNRVWLALHLTSYAAFALLTLHGILAGTDTTTPWMLAIYCAASAMVLWLTLARVYFALRAARARAGVVAGRG
jgi:DMSO/TMAO reductase YedYZ heme-binding membrane subunit